MALFVSKVNFNAAHLDALIVRLDQQIDRGVTAILHHPEFQALEARWAGMRLLVESVPEEFSNDDADDRDRIVISLWNISKRELADDLQFAESLRRSALFGKVYDSAYNIAGGQPFGILIGDYEFSDHPRDVALLRDLASVCETAFSPFIAAASPAIFHLDRFEGLFALTRSDLRDKRETILATLFREPAYIDWNELRRSSQARFVALTLPRCLMRPRYDAALFLGRRVNEEESEQPSHYCESQYSGRSDTRLWGSSAFALGQVVLRSFSNSGWLADIHGISSDRTRAGVVALAVREEFFLDEPNLFPSITTEVALTDELEKELGSLGFMSLCDRQPIPNAFFGSTPTIYQPDENEEIAARVIGKLSSMLQYTLCASRFAHYIKRIGHDHVGTMGDFADYERVLHDFLIQYVLDDENAAVELKARQPLNDASVRVRPVPGRKGEFHCEIMLKPHYELDAVEVHLETEIVGRQAS